MPRKTEKQPNCFAMKLCNCELVLPSLIHAKQNYLVNDILGMIDTINRYGNYKIHKNASSQAVIYKLTNPIPACLAALTHMNVTGRSKMA